MMNETVARIVEIMFQDVEMNEETSAIREEVMNNCQERYNDLVTSGLNEDDAISAVIESLKGMEDVLEPYQKKDVHGSREPHADELSGEQHVAYASCTVSRIDVNLVNEDVNVAASKDDKYHVMWNADELPYVAVEQHDDVLCILRKSENVVKMNTGDPTEFIRKDKGKIEIDMDRLDGMLKSIMNSVKNTFSNLKFDIGSGSAVTIRVPETAVPHAKVLTASGDINIQDAALTDVNITSISGDIHVDKGAEQYLERVELRTTSGDIEAYTHTERASMSSTSGDVEAKGRYDKLSISTISGDVDVCAAVESMDFSAISGDVNLEFNSDVIRKVSGSTVSGDVSIDLPDGIGTMAIQTQTRSGDVNKHGHTNGMGPTVTGSVSTMSGNITIR